MITPSALMVAIAVSNPQLLPAEQYVIDELSALTIYEQTCANDYQKKIVASLQREDFMNYAYNTNMNMSKISLTSEVESIRLRTEKQPKNFCKIVTDGLFEKWGKPF